MKKIILLSFLPFCFSCIKTTTNNSEIPDGAIWKVQAIRVDNAPLGFTAIAPWAQAATLNSNQLSTELAVVEIDYWKIIENIDGIKNVIYTEEYNYNSLITYTINEAGLYCRFPSWFDVSCNDQHDVAFNMSAQNGTLTIDVAKTPSNIVHWWTTPRLNCKPNATYSIEARLKVRGRTAIQFGMDYWRTLTAGFNHYDANCTTSNNCEAWISNWILPTNDEFITVTVPKRQ